jgi:hypothetical protein
MKIDGHPFLANMVDVGNKGNTLQTKMLTSQSAKESGAIDPKAQIIVDEAKGKGPQQREESAVVRIDGPRGGELGLFQISKIDKTTLTYAMLVRLNSPTG